MIREYIIKIDEDKKDIMGNCPLVEKPQELIRCKDCKKRNSWECWQYFFGRIKIPDDWFCADGERRSE